MDNSQQCSNQASCMPWQTDSAQKSGHYAMLLPFLLLVIMLWVEF